MSTTEQNRERWRRYGGGRGWRVLESGVIFAEHPSTVGYIGSVHFPSDEAYLYRTKGEPRSMQQLLADYGPTIREASQLFDVPMHTIMGLIAIEATRLKEDRLRFDPRSLRLEPGYESDKRTPNKVSPGLMQTLLSTANDMLPRVPELAHESSVDRIDLFVPRYSILLGTAYVRHQMDRVEGDEAGLPGDDPILNAVAAYNAGSVRGSSSNDWNLQTYGEDRIDKFIAYSNDALAVLGAVTRVG